jgi:hypothetical protein
MPNAALMKNSVIACPNISSRPSFKDMAGFECLDIKQDTNSCGGCVSAGSGVDCSTLEGVVSSGCSDGKCKICKSIHHSPHFLPLLLVYKSLI